LRNRWFEVVGRERRGLELDAARAASVANDADFRTAVERALDSQEAFGPDDLGLIRVWTPRERLVLLCLSGLWHKVPAATWRSWVAEHRDRYGIPVGGPFPPDALVRCDGIAERNTLLAETLQLRRNTLSVMLYRGKFRLLEPKYVRDLIGPYWGAQP